MKGIEKYVKVTSMTQERFNNIGYVIETSNKKIVFNNQNVTLFKLEISYSEDEITILTKDNCYYTNEVIITCDSDGTPTLYFNSMQHGIVLLNIDNDGNELLFLM